MTLAPLADRTFRATPEQDAAIRHPLTPLLVVAGAGTGKTTVMAERVLHVIESGQAVPHEVLALTFTNKAAGQLRQCVRDRLGADADVTVATYHSFGAGLVAAHTLELGLDPGTRVLNRAQAWQLLFAVFDDFRFDKRSSFAPQLIVNDALNLASRCADHLVPTEAVEADCRALVEGGRWKPMKDAAAKRLELCQVVSAYGRRKRDRNLIDYDDQVGLAVRLLREHPGIAEALRAQHPVVLLDEYQDTNYAQRVLLQLVYGPGSAITAVGDDMQSIYGFRGAHLGNILHFDEHFPPVVTRPLETNRRSGPDLVALANRIQGQVREAHAKELRALDGAPPTRVECFLAADENEEAAEIARDIAERGEPWDSHAVLCRKRRLIPPIVAALEERGIPVDVIGASGLLARPEVVDLVAWLELLDDPGNSVALVRILQGPRYRIGWRDLAALARHIHEQARAEREAGFVLADALHQLDAVEGLSAAARSRLAGFAGERRHLAATAARLPVLDLAEAIVDHTGLWGAAGERGHENLLRFLDLAARFEPVEGDAGLPAFLEYLHLLEESEEEVAESHLTDTRSVRVMTIHQAKGLEFPHVWVPGLATGIFPDNRGAANPLRQAAALPWWLGPEDTAMPDWKRVPRETDIADELRRRHLDEERRLFYVACTRAERLLVCSAAHWYAGPATPQGPSQFYDFVSEQADLVAERFRHEAAPVDPAVAAMERRRAAARKHPLPDPVAVDDAPSPVAAGGAAAPPTAVSAPARAAPLELSVTALSSYARCPLQFWWAVVRPLPSSTSPAARLGTQVHRWIEERAARPLTLLEPAAERDPELAADPITDAGPATGSPPAVPEGFRASFLASPYAGLEPVRVEAPFVMAAGGHAVRGRIDAVYEREGRLELVDFKTGRPHLAGDPGAPVQLDLYALAAVDTWGADPDRLRTTYCWLRPGEEPELESRDWDQAAIASVRRHLTAWLSAIDASQFAAHPGGWCGRCEFLDFCPAGQAALSG